MTASMTAYARSAIQKEWGQAIWECRSVNHRYLDLSFKMPEKFREWEIDWRNIVGNTLQRGKVECSLTFLAAGSAQSQLKVNTDLVNQLLVSCQAVAQFPNVRPEVKAMELLRWPEVLTSASQDISSLKEPLTALFQQALADLVQARLREGKQLQALLKARLDNVLVQVSIVKERIPQCLQAQKQKLEQKLNDIHVTVDRDRLEQELVYYAQRIDVEEEIERLMTHTKEVSRALETKGAMGRRLDFLMQEMNREANTLAAKSGDHIVTQAAIELKVLIEQMREQIQNVE
jgi:uncharacterized protein (TIGR00255 family)